LLLFQNSLTANKTKLYSKISTKLKASSGPIAGPLDLFFSNIYLNSLNRSQPINVTLSTQYSINMPTKATGVTMGIKGEKNAAARVVLA